MIRELFETIKAKFRGEKRIKPLNIRGRVFERKEKPLPRKKGGSPMSPTAKANIELKMRIVRADGTIEERTSKGNVTKIGD